MDTRGPLAVGGVSGVATSLIVTFLRSLARDPVFESLPVELPTCLEGPLAFEDTPWFFFAAGIAVGVCIGPAIDLLWLWRQRWRRFIWFQSSGTGGSKSLYRVVG